MDARLGREQGDPTGDERKQGEHGQDEAESHGGMVWWCGGQKPTSYALLYLHAVQHSGGLQP